MGHLLSVPALASSGVTDLAVFTRKGEIQPLSHLLRRSQSHHQPHQLLCAASHSRLRVDLLEVRLDGVNPEKEGLRNLLQGASRCRRNGHTLLGRRETVGAAEKARRDAHRLGRIGKKGNDLRELSVDTKSTGRTDPG